MDERLKRDLETCDLTGNLDLAAEALVKRISDLAGAAGQLPREFKYNYAAGIGAYKRARLGTPLARPELRALAELEDALESMLEDAPQTRSRQQFTREVLASISKRLPAKAANLLARSTPSTGESSILGRGDAAEDFLASESCKLYALVATATFLLILGVASLPTAISYGGNTWWSALLPLACVVFLAWILLKILRA